MFFPLTFLPADTFLVNMLSFRHAVTGPRTLVGCKAGYFIYFMLTSHLLAVFTTGILVLRLTGPVLLPEPELPPGKL